MFILRFLRRLLAKVIQLLLMNRLVTVGLLVVLVAAFVVLPLVASGSGLPVPGIAPAAAQPAQAPSAAAAAAAAASATQGVAPDPAVETYIKGLMSFDANLMWTSLHPAFRSQLQSQGTTLDTQKAQLDQMQASGAVYEKAYYVGGFAAKSGFRYYTYVLTHKGSDGTSEGGEMAYTFTVAPDGGGILDISIQ
jgi:hypothetical protein